jgi:hypothetical protein
VIKILKMRKREREFHHEFIKISRWRGRTSRDDDKED